MGPWPKMDHWGKISPLGKIGHMTKLGPMSKMAFGRKRVVEIIWAIGENRSFGQNGPFGSLRVKWVVV